MIYLFLLTQNYILGQYLNKYKLLSNKKSINKIYCFKKEILHLSYFL